MSRGRRLWRVRVGAHAVPIVLALGALAAAARPVSACPSCSPVAAPAVRADASADDRTRLGADLRVSTEAESVGTGEARLDVREWRVALGLEALLGRRATIAATLPWATRSATLPASGITLGSAAQLGDLDTLAAVRAVSASRHALELSAGVRWPTGPAVHDDAGELVVADAQVGSGSIWPVVGARWTATTSARTELVVATTAAVPLSSRYDWQLGPTSQSRVELGIQASPWLRVTPGAALRHDGPGAVDGERDPDTGGTVASATLRSRATTRAGVYVESAVDVPVATALDGHQTRSPRFSLGVGFVGPVHAARSTTPSSGPPSEQLASR